MTVLLNNLPALIDPVTVSLSDALGSPDEAGGTLTIGSETLTVIEGGGTVNLLANRGISPSAHLVGSSVTYGGGVVMRKQVTTLTPAMILAMGDTPITVVDAPGAGKMILVMGGLAAVAGGSIPWSYYSNPFTVFVGAYSDQFQVAIFQGAPGDGFTVLAQGLAGGFTPYTNDESKVVNKPAIIQAGGNPSNIDGDISVEITVYYVVVDVA